MSPFHNQSTSIYVSNVKEYHNEREDSNIVFDQRKGMIQAEQEDEQEDAGQAEMFLKAEEKALAMEQTRREMLIQMQLQNLQHIITTNSLKYNEKSYEAFFKTDETKAVMEEPVFISGVCNLLEGGELNTRVYRVFINYYHLRNEIWENMENEKANLYTIISDYVNIDGRVRLKQGVGAGIGAVLFMATREFFKSSTALVMALVGLAATVGVYWLVFRVLSKRLSFIKSHIVNSIIIPVIAFLFVIIVGMFGISEDRLINFYIILFFGNILYLLGTIVYAVIHKAMINSKRKKRQRGVY